MRRLGRILQLAGLVIIPIAVAGNLAEIANAQTALTLKESLLLSALGGAVFLVGWLLQHSSGK
jgi:hypothetical protein